MPRYQVSSRDGIKRQATGESWPCGAYISPHNWPKPLWEALLEEGAIVEIASDVQVVDATSAAVARAAENDVKLSDVPGTGKDGRILASDVDEYIKARAE